MANSEGEDPVLLVEHVSKRFRLPTEQANGLKQTVINWARGIKGYREQNVLDDITFSVNRGDFFGIVGRNGSGKSTLLKIISKIYVPNSGKVTVHGQLVPFIELGVGFNPELTGRENVYLNGALLGFDKDQIDAMYDDIVAFAELEEFMDQKLKNYSSGMQVRLAFSVAIKAQGDILVLDEVLAVGDEAFQRKCNAFFEQIKSDSSKTVILVTHDMGAIKRYCNKAILISDGKIVVSGNKTEVADRYTVENIKPQESTVREEAEEEPKEEKEYATGLCAEIPLLKVRPSQGIMCKPGDDFAFEVEYEHHADRHVYINISLMDQGRGGMILGERFDLTQSGHQVVHFRMPTTLFTNSNLRIMVSVHVPKDSEDPTNDEMIGFTNDESCCDFIIRGSEGEDNYGLINDRSLNYVCLDTGMASKKHVTFR